jgi:hypothetical protein
MELPALFYGLYRDVKRRTSRIVNQIPKGADWMALVEADGFLDTTTTPGFILIDGPSPNRGSEHHFQQWVLWAQIKNKWAHEWSRRSKDADKWGVAVQEAVFQQSLTKPWSTLGLVENDSWLFPKHRYRPFLHAVRRYWELFDSVGARYSTGLQTPQPLWALPNTIKYVLANLSVPGDMLRAPLPPGGLAELIDRTEQHLH